MPECISSNFVIILAVMWVSIALNLTLATLYCIERIYSQGLLSVIERSPYGAPAAVGDDAGPALTD